MKDNFEAIQVLKSCLDFSDFESCDLGRFFFFFLIGGEVQKKKMRESGRFCYLCEDDKIVELISEF